MFDIIRQYAPASLGGDKDLVIRIPGTGGQPSTERRVRLVLTEMYGDTPMAAKYRKCKGHQAYKGCGSCTLLGEAVGGAGSGVCFLGYENDAKCWQLTDRFPESALCGAAGIKISSAEQLSRAEAVCSISNPEERKKFENELACTGMPLASTCSYVDLNSIHMVPFMHSALLGVTKRFFNLSLGTVARGEARPGYLFSTAAKKASTNFAVQVPILQCFIMLVSLRIRCSVELIHIYVSVFLMSNQNIYFVHAGYGYPSTGDFSHQRFWQACPVPGSMPGQLYY